MKIVAVCLFALIVSVACAAPHVPAPKVKPTVTSKGLRVVAATTPPATAADYTPSFTNIEVRVNGSATLRIDSKGKRAYFLSGLVDASCTTVTDLATQKVVMKLDTKKSALCAEIKVILKVMEDFVSDCVASGGCSL